MSKSLLCTGVICHTNYITYRNTCSCYILRFFAEILQLEFVTFVGCIVPALSQEFVSGALYPLATQEKKGCFVITASIFFLCMFILGDPLLQVFHIMSFEHERHKFNTLIQIETDVFRINIETLTKYHYSSPDVFMDAQSTLHSCDL